VVDAEGADVVSEQVPGQGMPDGQVVVEELELDLALGDRAVPVLVLYERGTPLRERLEQRLVTVGRGGV
jgi:hypothetical protein